MSRLEDYANWLLKNKAKAGTEEFNRVAGAYSALRSNEQAGITGNEGLNDKAVQREAQLAADRKTFDPTSDMSGAARFRAGAGKAFSDLAQGASQYLPGGATRQDVAETRRLDAPLMATGAGMAGNVVGNVATAIPTAMIPGANTVTGSALIGAGMGALQPSVSTGETMKNIGIGGAASAAIPLAINGGKVAKSFVDPLYQGGRDQIMGRALRGAAGNQADDAMNAMRTAKSAVPGVEYTAAEAAGNPGIAAMQRTATAIDPVAMNASVARQAQNNAARVAALDELSGSGGKRAFYEANRDATANALYDKARKAGVDVATLTPEAQANMASFQGRIPEDVMNRARELAKINGETMDNGTSIKGLHWVKKAIDSKIGSAVTSGDKEMARAYQGLKNDLLNGLDEISPAYGEARRTFSEMSKPLTEMDVAQSVADKSINKLTGNITPSAYANALTDKTATQATGMRNATLGKTLSPETLAMLNAIKGDMQAQNFSQTAGRGVGSDTVQKLAFSNMLDAAGVPSAVRSFAPAGIVGNLAQRGGQIVYKDANEKMAAQLAQALLNPQDAAKLMEAGMVTPQMIALMNGLRRTGTAAGAVAPGLVQANQQ